MSRGCLLGDRPAQRLSQQMKAVLRGSEIVEAQWCSSPSGTCVCSGRVPRRCPPCSPPSPAPAAARRAPAPAPDGVDNIQMKFIKVEAADEAGLACIVGQEAPSAVCLPQQLREQPWPASSRLHISSCCTTAYCITSKRSQSLAHVAKRVRACDSAESDDAERSRQVHVEAATLFSTMNWTDGTVVAAAAWGAVSPVPSTRCVFSLSNSARLSTSSPPSGATWTENQSMMGRCMPYRRWDDASLINDTFCAPCIDHCYIA